MRQSTRDAAYRPVVRGVVISDERYAQRRERQVTATAQLDRRDVHVHNIITNEKPNSITLSWSQTGAKLVTDLLARASLLLAS